MESGVVSQSTRLLIENVVNESIKQLECVLDKKLKAIECSIFEKAKAYIDSEVGACKACEIFSKEKNVDAFYTMTSDYKGMVARTTSYKWVIGLLSASIIPLLCKLFGAF